MVYDLSNLSGFTDVFSSGVLVGLFFVILVFLAVYVYHAFAWMTIAKKLKYKNPWFAWIPVLNIVMILQLGGFHWAWIFLTFIPILGWIALFVMIIISTWRIFEKRKYPGWLALVPLGAIIPVIGGLAYLAYLIILGFVAWKDK